MHVGYSQGIKPTRSFSIQAPALPLGQKLLVSASAARWKLTPAVTSFERSAAFRTVDSFPHLPTLPTLVSVKQHHRGSPPLCVAARSMSSSKILYLFTGVHEGPAQTPLYLLTLYFLPRKSYPYSHL